MTAPKDVSYKNGTWKIQGGHSIRCDRVGDMLNCNVITNAGYFTPKEMTVLEPLGIVDSVSVHSDIGGVHANDGMTAFVFYTRMACSIDPEKDDPARKVLDCEKY